MSACGEADITGTACIRIPRLRFVSRCTPELCGVRGAHAHGKVLRAPGFD